MLKGATARRYAEAVFEIGVEQGTVDRWRADLSLIAEYLGDHSLAFGTGIRRWPPVVPVLEPIVVVPVRTSAVTDRPAAPWTTRSSTPAATSGVVSSRVM